MKNFYALFNTFLCIGIDIGIGRLCNCHIGIGIGIGRYENQIYRWLSVSADMKKCLSVAHCLCMNSVLLGPSARAVVLRKSGTVFVLKVD